MPEPNQKESLENNKIIRLDPPETQSIPKDFAKLVGQEATDKHIQELFATEYFKLIQEDIEKRFQNKNIGLRAILCSTSKDKVKIDGRKRLINTIKNILSIGGDLNNNNTRITIPGEITTDGKNHTEMSAYYLSICVKNAIKSGKKEVVPAILIYDLSTKGITKNSDYTIHFANEEAKKESLLAVYTLDISALQSKINLQELLP